MTHQLRHLEMQPFIAEPKLCHLTGNVNLIDWYADWIFIMNSNIAWP